MSHVTGMITCKILFLAGSERYKIEFVLRIGTGLWGGAHSEKMSLDGSAAGAEDVLAAALIERPSEQQAPESKKRSRRAAGPPAPKCSNCGRKPQRR